MKFTILEDSFLVAQYHHKPTFLQDNKRSYIERKYAFPLCYNMTMPCHNYRFPYSKCHEIYYTGSQSFPWSLLFYTKFVCFMPRSKAGACLIRNGFLFICKYDHYSHDTAPGVMIFTVFVESFLPCSLLPYCYDNHIFIKLETRLNNKNNISRKMYMYLVNTMQTVLSLCQHIRFLAHYHSECTSTVVINYLET